MADEITPEAFAQLQADLKAAQEAAKTATSLQEDVEALKLNNQALLKEKKTAKDAAHAAEMAAAQKSGDFEALEKSWQDKLNAETSNRDDIIKKMTGSVSDMTAGATARTMAAELALPGSADVLLPHIKSRLSVDMSGDSPLVRVLDKDGKPSAMSIDDLREEIEADKAFAPLLLGSMASGAGPAGGKGNPAVKTMSRDEWNTTAPDAQSKFIADGGAVIDIH